MWWWVTLNFDPLYVMWAILNEKDEMDIIIGYEQSLKVCLRQSFMILLSNRISNMRVSFLVVVRVFALLHLHRR
jgi:hypothetical protein